MDFTIKKYQALISTLKESGYRFVTFSEYLQNKLEGYVIIMRHDVDEQAHNALKMAKVENELGIKATYFFRIAKQSNKPDIIRQIVAMGHEIGYHYEDLSTANGDYEKAIVTFREHLEYFRTFYPVTVVCMHGSSTSKYDNRLLWQKYYLGSFGLIGEPYLSLDFEKIFYVTDTGYAWDGGKYATRDVVENKFGLTFHTSDEMIDSVREGFFPKQAMILAHTLWTDSRYEWIYFHLREFFRNRVKLYAKKNKYIALLYQKAVTYYWK